MHVKIATDNCPHFVEWIRKLRCCAKKRHTVQVRSSRSVRQRLVVYVISIFLVVSWLTILLFIIIFHYAINYYHHHNEYCNCSALIINKMAILSNESIWEKLNLRNRHTSKLPTIIRCLAATRVIRVSSKIRREQRANNVNLVTTNSAWRFLLFHHSRFIRSATSTYISALACALEAPRPFNLLFVASVIM